MGVTNAEAPLEPPEYNSRAPFQSAKNVPKYGLKMLNGRKKGESICKNSFRQMIEPNQPRQNVAGGLPGHV